MSNFVLPEDACSDSEVTIFPGFPGLWTPGVPVDSATLGLSASELQTQIDELGLPIVAAPARGKTTEAAQPDAAPDQSVHVFPNAAKE